MTALRPSFDSVTFRRALGHVPTAVSVVTATDEQGHVGMTVGSFTSISLEPPLVGFFADTESATLQRIRNAGSFCVNVLTDRQNHACMSFASKVADRFAGIDVLPGQHAAPRLAGSMAWIDCTVDCLVEFGDHVVIVGRVHELEVSSGNHRPLVFFRGKLCNLDRRTVPSKGHWQLDHYADW